MRINNESSASLKKDAGKAVLLGNDECFSRNTIAYGYHPPSLYNQPITQSNCRHSQPYSRGLKNNRSTSSIKFRNSVDAQMAREFIQNVYQNRLQQENRKAVFFEKSNHKRRSADQNLSQSIRRQSNATSFKRIANTLSQIQSKLKRAKSELSINCNALNEDQFGQFNQNNGSSLVQNQALSIVSNNVKHHSQINGKWGQYQQNQGQQHQQHFQHYQYQEENSITNILSPKVSQFQDFLMSPYSYHQSDYKEQAKQRRIQQRSNQTPSSSSTTKTHPSLSAMMPYTEKIKTYYLEQVVRAVIDRNRKQLQVDASTRMFSFAASVQKGFTDYKASDLSAAYDHLNISLKIIRSINNFVSQTEQQITQRKVNLPRHNSGQTPSSRKTLILDIDQTILHCEQDDSQPYDLVLPIKLDKQQYANAYITIRPYAISFLKKMSKLFEIIAFTASHQSYADVVLDQIDPNHQYIHHRLYRHHCFQIHPNIYTKDLRIINRQMSEMVLVDNAPYSYLFQIENGIPILPYYKGEDCQLPKLEKYLEKIHKQKDVRNLNRQTFKLNLYKKYAAGDGIQTEMELPQLVQELYIQPLRNKDKLKN